MKSIALIARPTAPGIWMLAWHRLCCDRVGLVSLAVVVAYVLVVVAAVCGWIAQDWSREVGVNYAPPTSVGAESTPLEKPSVSAPEATILPDDTGIADPLADVIAEIKKGM